MSLFWPSGRIPLRVRERKENFENGTIPQKFCPDISIDPSHIEVLDHIEDSRPRELAINCYGER
jgi:hypothetical protein